MLLAMALWSVVAGAAPASGSVLDAAQWLDSVSVPIRSLEPDTPTDDLARLAEWTRGAAIIGLGDGSHGTKEFYSVKHRIIEELVRDAGVRTIAFEGPWPEFNRINAYIQGGTGRPLDALRSEWWFWNTREIDRLIEWARAWNKSHPGSAQIEFRGVDMALPPSLFEDVLGYLREIDPRIAAEAENRFGCFREFSSYWRRNDSEKRACRSGLESVLTYLKQHASKGPGAADRRWQVIRSAEMILQSEALYRDSEAYDFAKRDAFMADNVARLRKERASAAPIVYWAHNGHVGASRIPFYRNQRSAGCYLADRFGRRYYSIGSITATGAFLAWDETAERPVRLLHFPMPSETSYEGLFARTRFDACMVSLDGEGGRRFMAPRSLSFGMGSPSVQQPVVDIRNMFDAVVFIRHTHPTDYLGPR